MTDTDHSTDPPDDILEAIEFVARSPHRASVLAALAEGPRTRHELRERADVSRITVRRLVDDLAERGWIMHDDGQYEATATGRAVAREFSRLYANLETVDTLDDALRWLPTDEFDFDLACLQNATVLTAESWPDQAAAVTHAVERVRETEAIRGTAIGFTPEVVEAIRERVVDDRLTFEAVVDETAYGMIRENPGLREPFEAIISSANGALYRYTGAAPLHMVQQFDDAVLICGHVDEGPPPGTLETDVDAVLSWAESYYETALAESTPVSVEMLAPEPSDDD